MATVLQRPRLFILFRSAGRDRRLPLRAPIAAVVQRRDSPWLRADGETVLAMCEFTSRFGANAHPRPGPRESFPRPRGRRFHCFAPR